ncbi:N-terminal Xaa-Pro-Lys N-methyltransferase 1-B [Hermetia illucens]|nr:N-terminal Xaa-Pro-Lys N-methyltransferase 1-B [Hermetia illucens]
MENAGESSTDDISEQIQDIKIVTTNNLAEDSPVKEEATDSKDSNKESPFYDDAKKYWSKVPATVDGMLGGFGGISYRDIKGSSSFLKDIFKMKPTVERRTAVDCGAGIGRVTKSLLFPLFQTVDMVEQDENFANSAREYLGGNASQLGTIYNIGLQNFTPEPGKYDVIWCQWVLSHLTDEDLQAFLERASVGLAKNGVIVLKENVTSSGEIEVDTTDSSITRPLRKFQDIIQSANLRIVKTIRQTDLPKGLYPIYMMALRPVRKS